MSSRVETEFVKLVSYLDVSFQVLGVQLIDQLLEELSRNEAIKVSIQGPIMDSATVALPTFLGGVCGGPAGAVFGINL